MAEPMEEDDGGAVDAENFRATFPELASLVIRIVETSPQRGVVTHNFSLQSPPPRALECSHPECKGGVLNLWIMLRGLIEKQTTRHANKLPCPGGHRQGRVQTMACTSAYDLSFEIEYK